MWLEAAQIILSDKSNRLLEQSLDTYAMMIIYLEEESYATETEKGIMETEKKYH